MKKCEIKEGKSKVIRIDPETQVLLEKYKKRIIEKNNEIYYMKDLETYYNNENRLIKKALIDILNKL